MLRFRNLHIQMVRPRKVLRSAKYVTKKGFCCHVPKVNQILGKLIKFQVNAISILKVKTFLHRKNDPFPWAR